jgi:NAD(P)H-nitrite reductase large subunit
MVSASPTTSFGTTLDGDPIVCRCLKVSATQLVEAIVEADLKTVREIRRYTGAGDGCTACHCVLKEYLLRHRAEATQAAPAFIHHG